MLAKAWLLVAALMVSPAWAQQPSASFDLRGDAVRRIVRDTAATQVAMTHLPPDAFAGRQPRPEDRAHAIVFVPVEKPLPPARNSAARATRPVRASTAPPPPAPLLVRILGGLVEAILEPDPQPLTFEEAQELRTSCLQHDDLLSVTDRYLACPNRKVVNRVLNP